MRSARHSGHAHLRQTLTIVLVAILFCFLAGCAKARSHDHYKKGQQFVQAGDWNSAKREFEKSAELDGNFADPHFQLALWYLRYTDFATAADELKIATVLAPENLPALLRLAQLQLAGGDLAGLKQSTDLILQRDPSNIEAHLLQVQSLMRIEQWDAARTELSRQIAAAHNRTEPYLVLGNLEESQQHWPEAEHALKKALELSSPSAATSIALGNFYSSQQRWSEAEAAFAPAIPLGDPAAYSAMASMYLSAGRPMDAERTARSAQSALPNEPTAYRLLANVFIASKDLEKATAEYGRLMQLHPEDQRAIKNYTQLLVLTERADEASRVSFDLQHQHMNDVELMLLQGQIELRRGHPELAESALEPALVAQPNNYLAHFYSGLARQEMGDFGAADRELKQSQELQDSIRKSRLNAFDPSTKVSASNETSQKIAELVPLSPLGYARASDIELSRGHADTAEARQNEAMHAYPNSPVAYARLARLRMSQEKLPDADLLFTRALSLSPGYPDAVSGLVTLYTHQQQPDRALQLLNAQIASVPNSSALYSVLARFYFDQNRLEDAESAGKKALLLDHKNDDAYLILSKVQQARGELPQAIASIEQWVQDDPTARGFVELGELYEHSGRWQQAQDSFHKALSLDSNFTMATNDLALSLLDHDGNPDVAVTFAAMGRAREPYNPAFADTLGWAYYKKGLYRNALPLLEEAIARLPNDPQAHYHLGLTYRKVAQTSKAEDELRHVLQLDPNFAHADLVKQNLATLNPKLYGSLH